MFSPRVRIAILVAAIVAGLVILYLQRTDAFDPTHATQAVPPGRFAGQVPQEGSVAPAHAR